jgi:ATP-dependent protease ClpP protease subunit
MTEQLRDWFRFVTNKANPKTAEVHIYGDIGTTFWGDGVAASDFVDQLDALSDVEELGIRINSPGGSAWDGMTIANAIIRHPAHTTTYIDGLAASAASIVAVAGDDVVVSKYGQAMLHNARAVVMGTAKDMREVAQQLDKLNATMAGYYADRAGGDAAAFAGAMAKETWYNADEMLAAGLATRVDDSGVREEVERAVASAMAVTAEQFRYQGRPAAPAPVARDTKGSKGTETMADKKTIAESLGLKDDATEDEILAATKAALGVKDADADNAGDKDGDATKVDEKPIVDAPPEPAKAAASAADGTVVLDKATYEQLMANSAKGAEAHATLQAQADARVVESAIEQGRITPARRDHYMAAMKADRADTTDLLTKRLQPGAAVPLQEIGHSADATPSATVKENPLYAGWEL